MDGMRRDVAYAVRRMVRSPGFTLVAVLSLTLGIGANTAIFSFVDAVLLRASPVEAPEELVDLFSRQEGFSHGALSFLDLQELEERTADVFSAIGYYRPGLFPADADDGTVDLLPAQLVSGEFFTVQGLDAAVGRTLLPEDHLAEGAHPVVVLGHGYWQRRFAGDPGVVGRELRIAGQPLTVVGVVESAKARSLGEAPRPFLYGSLLQDSSPYAQLVARTAGADPRVAALGLYGVVSYAAARKVREAGIRMSLGAVAVAASWVPARQATRVDPIRALKAD